MSKLLINKGYIINRGIFQGEVYYVTDEDIYARGFYLRRDGDLCTSSWTANYLRPPKDHTETALIKERIQLHKQHIDER